MRLFEKKPDNRLRLLGVMQRERIPLPQPSNADFEAAKQRCLACNSKKLCDEGAMRLALFCPNSHYLKSVSGNFF